MREIKGPALFLAQFAGDEAPFNSWDAITKWAADCGYVGVQVPSWDDRLIDLTKAAESKDYCDEFKGVAAANGIAVTELSTNLTANMVATIGHTLDYDNTPAFQVAGPPPSARRQRVDNRILLPIGSTF